MRSLALLGSFLLACGLQAQSLAEHAAAASGATIGTAAGKPVSNAITKIFGTVENDTKKASGVKADTRIPAKPAAEAPGAAPAAGNPQGIQSVDDPLPRRGTSYAPSRRRAVQPEAPAPQYQPAVAVRSPYVYRVVEEPPLKEPTPEEFASVKVGATEKELIAALGPPSSRVTIPEEGHLLETCQYWAKGKQLGTVRLDNGQVVTVESRTQN